MTEERNGYSGPHNPTTPLYDKCQKYMFHHVTATMRDGNTFDGIIESVDQDQVSMLVGEDVMERDGEEEFDSRQYYGGYGYPHGRRFRRFRRRFLPLAALTALSLFPYYSPYPYYPHYPQYPQYPHYPYYPYY